MATKKFSTLANNASVTFNPASDVFQIDKATASAADFTITSPSATTTKFVGGGKTITLKTAIEKLTATNVTFADGSKLLVGDKATGTANDGAANTLAGTTHDDQILGLAGADKLTGGGGNDVLNGGSGKDTLSGGNGDDVLVYDGTDSVDGGTGSDVLKVTAASLGLAGKAGTALKSIEVISLDNAHGSLTLSAQQVVNLSSTDTLRVMGGASDSVHAAGAWARDANVTVGTQTYAKYTQGDATLLVDTDIDRTDIHVAEVRLSALAASDGFTLTGTDNETYAGGAVAAAGDVNGDGFSDLIVGAYGEDSVGAAYLVLGDASGFGSGATLQDLVTAGKAFALTGGGLSAFSGLGEAVAGGGDFNGDGFADVVVGAQDNDSDAGDAFVVFGGSGLASAIPVTALGGGGFHLNGAAAEHFGNAVGSAGDVNGDGFDDLVVGAWYADPGAVNNAGAAYVLFGGSALGAIDSSGLDGANGFRLTGAAATNYAGSSVSAAGDVNGDGIGDVIVGAYWADSKNGAAYVVFGKTASFDSIIAASSLDGSNGFAIFNDTGGNSDRMGRSVASAGDVNGDGVGDVIIGAAKGTDSPGKAFVVFGRADGVFDASMDVSDLNGNDGFRLVGVAAGDDAGNSVSGAGDVNGDGYDDLLVGAYEAASYGGEAYVVFGKAGGFTSSISLSTLNGANGFTLVAVAEADHAGQSVSSAGDVNGDGFADILVGAPDNGVSSQGAAYVIFGGDSGSAGVMGSKNADTLAGGAGDAIFGGAGNDRITISSADFLRVDGGGGTDTLKLAAGLSLDFSSLQMEKVRGIEVIDLGATGANTLTIGLFDVLALSDSGNDLRVDGSASDTVSLLDGWDFDRTEGGYDYYVFEGTNATLEIAEFITMQLPG